MGNGSSSGAKRNDADDEMTTRERSVQSVMTGELTSIPEEHGRDMLEVGFDIAASDGNSYHFGSDLVLKYEKGVTQEGNVKKEGADPARFRHLPYATNALKSSKSEIYEQNGKISQKLFLCRQSETKATAVYVNSSNKAVRSYVFTNRSEKRVDAFMEARKKNYEKA